MSRLFNRGVIILPQLCCPLSEIWRSSPNPAISSSLSHSNSVLSSNPTASTYTPKPLMYASGRLKLQMIPSTSNSNCVVLSLAVSRSLPWQRCCRQRAVTGRIHAGGVVEGGAEGAKSHGLDVCQFRELGRQPDTQRRTFVATIVIIKHRTKDGVSGARL